MVLDVGKGAAAVCGLRRRPGRRRRWRRPALRAIVGHIYPVWLRFHGGKGVAVAAGVFACSRRSRRCCRRPCSSLTVWATRYVSLGSLAATMALPPVAWLTGAPAPSSRAARGTGALILFRHRANLRRLRAGTERRVALFKRRTPTVDADVRIAVLGAGSWGTALAVHLARVGHDVRLWGRDAALVDEMRATRANAVYLPDVRCPRTRAPTASLEAALAERRCVVVGGAVARHARTSCARRAVAARRRVARQRDQGARERLAARMSRGDRARSSAPAHPVVVLSGPSFAPEVARGAADGRARRLRRARRRRRACRTSFAARRSGSTAATTWPASRSAAR